MDKKMTKKQNLALASAGLVLLFLIWIWASSALGDTRVPSPWKIVNRFGETVWQSPEIQFQGAGSNGFLPHVSATLGRYLIGTLSGTAIAFICLFLIARYKSFKEIFNPLIDILRAIPPLALAPFFLLWFGTSQGGIIGIVIFYAFTMIFVAGAEALGRLDPVQADFARTLGAGKATIALRILLPSLLPSMAGPIKVAYSWSWGLVIVGELLGAKSGVGRILNAFIAILSTDLVVVGIVWILILAVVVEKAVAVALRWLLRWNAGKM